jgi:hypothetical protein
MARDDGPERWEAAAGHSLNLAKCSRSLRIAGLPGFFTLIQSRDGPDRYGAVIRFDTMPSRTIWRECGNIATLKPTPGGH